MGTVVFLLLLFCSVILADDVANVSVALKGLFNMPVMTPRYQRSPPLLNETCFVSQDYHQDITSFVEKCAGKARIVGPFSHKGNCFEMGMSQLTQKQFDLVFGHVVEISGITLVFNNTDFTMIDMWNLRWWIQPSVTEAPCSPQHNVHSEDEMRTCLNDRFSKSFKNCASLMVIENNLQLENVVLAQHFHDDVQIRNVKRLGVVVRNNPKLTLDALLEIGYLFNVPGFQEHFRPHEMCYPTVPLRRLDDLKGCRFIKNDVKIDHNTILDFVEGTVRLDDIDGCLQITNTTLSSASFLHDGTTIPEPVCKVGGGKTELSGNEKLCLTKNLWRLFKPNIADNKAAANCPTTTKQNCNGRVITSLEDLVLLENCKAVTGNLTIQDLTIKHPRHLKAMNDIVEIEGQLVIQNCTVKDIMLASLFSVGTDDMQPTVIIANVTGLKTVNMPMYWFGVDRFHDIQIRNCSGYLRPIHLGGGFEGSFNPGKLAAPISLPTFTSVNDWYVDWNHTSVWMFYWIFVPTAIVIPVTIVALKVYRHW